MEFVPVRIPNDLIDVPDKAATEKRLSDAVRGALTPETLAEARREGSATLTIKWGANERYTVVIRPYGKGVRVISLTPVERREQ
jgi:hypothetical protein